MTDHTDLIREARERADEWERAGGPYRRGGTGTVWADVAVAQVRALCDALEESETRNASAVEALMLAGRRIAELEAALDEAKAPRLYDTKADSYVQDLRARLRRIEEAAKVVVGWDLRPGYDRSENEAAIDALRTALEGEKAMTKEDI